MIKIFKFISSLIAAVSAVVELVEEPGNGALKRRAAIMKSHNAVIELGKLFLIPAWIVNAFSADAILGWLIDLIVHKRNSAADEITSTPNSGLIKIFKFVSSLIAAISAVVELVEEPGNGALKRRAAIMESHDAVIRLGELFLIPAWIVNAFSADAILGWLIDLIVYKRNSAADEIDLIVAKRNSATNVAALSD